MKKTRFPIKRKSSLFMAVMVILTTLMVSGPLQAASTCKVRGYVSPIVTSTDSTIKSGFSVQLTGTAYSANTDQSGYFEVANIPSGTYTVKIIKAGFLARSIGTISINSDVVISNQDSPAVIWPGDMVINGIQDGAINMGDILEIAKSFNTVQGNANYSANSDINKDNAVNMGDIIAVAAFFNKVSSDYPVITVINLPTPTPVPSQNSPLPTLPAGNYQLDSRIRVNSVGFLPEYAKKATIAASAADFYVVKDSGAVAFYGKTTSINNADTSEQVSVADFSALKESGTYYIAVPNIGKSITFKISSDALNDTFKASMLAMYLLRCNTSVSATYKGETFSHAACHTNDAYLDYINNQHTKKDGSKGWHDAGDYNKYVVNAGITVGSMLFAWEQYEDKLKNKKLTMPESSNSLPDFLDEIKYETDWLLTMQYPDGSGKVSHKLSAKGFCDFVLPEQESSDRFFTPWGTPATADFVAMTAMASRAFKPYDSSYADKLLTAAKLSYSCLKSNPNQVEPNQTGFTTGGYTTTSDSDERLWAAAEMWETTGDNSYLSDFEAIANSTSKKILADFDWADVGNLGMFTYLLSTRDGRNQTLFNTIKSALLSSADSIVQASNAHGYGRPLGTTYYWGCNGTVARQTMILNIANQLSPNPAYVNTSMDAIGFLLGRNSYNRSFVTGVGLNPPMKPHHRPSGGDSINNPWPGYLIGGPWPNAKSWIDDQEDYKTNEVAINWNGALIYALAGFVDETKQ